MSEELQQKLRDQLWEVANRLRGNMSASDFMYFTLGFIFYKYLSEKIEKYANNALADDDITFKELWEMEDADAVELQEEAQNQCLENIGYGRNAGLKLIGNGSGLGFSGRGLHGEAVGTFFLTA